MTKGLVSIITPMYNAKDTIEKTMISVINQTYENWEMIIVDDKSDDLGPELVKKYSDQDKRIKYVKTQVNSGVSDARNKAIEMSYGQYIAFLDSDDVWEPDKLKCQIEFMKEQGIGFCFSGCDCIDYEDSFIKERKVPSKVSYKDLLKGNVIPCLTVVLDREIISIPKMKKIHHEDYAMWLDILKTGKCAYSIQRVLAHYRIGQKSVSSNKLKAVKWTWDIYRKDQKLNVVQSGYYFVNYLIKAFIKWK